MKQFITRSNDGCRPRNDRLAPPGQRRHDHPNPSPSTSGLRRQRHPLHTTPCPELHPCNTNQVQNSAIFDQKSLKKIQKKPARGAALPPRPGEGEEREETALVEEEAAAAAASAIADRLTEAWRERSVGVEKIKRGESGGDEARSLNLDGNTSPPAYFVPVVDVACFDWFRKIRGAHDPCNGPH